MAASPLTAEMTTALSRNQLTFRTFDLFGFLLPPKASSKTHPQMALAPICSHLTTSATAGPKRVCQVHGVAAKFVSRVLLVLCVFYFNCGSFSRFALRVTCLLLSVLFVSTVERIDIFVIRAR